MEVTEWSMSPQECAESDFRAYMHSITYGNERKINRKNNMYYILKIFATMYENNYKEI